MTYEEAKELQEVIDYMVWKQKHDELDNMLFEQWTNDKK